VAHNPDTLALSPGAHVGPYEVVARIGVGGMGEVYRAIDTTLKRAVAIKVLPASVAGDAQRLTRFEREAEVLASLNHPNIAAIYGVQPWEGSLALVMELVEGDNLRACVRGRWKARWKLPGRCWQRWAPRIVQESSTAI